MTDHRVRVRRRAWWVRRPRWRAGLALIVSAVVVGAPVLVWRVLRAAPDSGTASRIKVTPDEVAAELRALGPAAAALPRKDLVDAVEGREVLAQEARRRGYDRRPTYPSDRRRREEQALALALLNDLPPPPPPAEARVRGYMAEHPELFTARRSYLLNVVVLSPRLLPPDPDIDWDEWMRRLQAEKAPFTLRDLTLLSSEAPGALASALAHAAQGDRITMVAGSTATVYHVATIEPAPLAGQAGLNEARRDVEAENRRKQVADLLTRLRGPGGTPAVHPGQASTPRA